MSDAIRALREKSRVRAEAHKTRRRLLTYCIAALALIGLWAAWTVARTVEPQATECILELSSHGRP